MADWREQQRRRDARRSQQEKREEDLKLAVAILLIVVALVSAGLYSYFYWTNCAFVPITEAPGLCWVGFHRSH